MTKDMREKKVRRIITEEAGFIIGGWENSVLDGHIEDSEFPTRGELIEEIYGEVMSDRQKLIEMNGMMMEVSRDIRFLGSERIRELITKKVNAMMEREGR